MNNNKFSAYPFGEYFEVISANTYELRKIVYQLRFQVYCVETGFENPNQYPTQLEIDPFDKVSVYILLKHRPTGLYVGTVRLILHHPEVGFPMDFLPTSPLFKNQKRFPRRKVAEISRFAISKQFRRRLAEFVSPSVARDDCYTDGHVHYQRFFLPHISLGLMQGLVRMSAEHGIKHWFIVTELSLIRLLTRYSVYLIPEGSPVEYHGQRQPCYVHIEPMLARVYEEQPEVWAFLTNNGQHYSGARAYFPLNQYRRKNGKISVQL